MSKGSEYPGVVATQVLDFIPYQEMIPNKVSCIVCDENIEQELAKKADNNDFLLRQKIDKDHSKMF